MWTLIKIRIPKLYANLKENMCKKANMLRVIKLCMVYQRILK